jgi:hypothetical protein
MTTEKKPFIVYASGTPYGVTCAGEHRLWSLTTFGGNVDGALQAAGLCEKCRPPTCEKHGPYSGFCRPCADEREAAKLEESFAKAKKVPIDEYDGEIVAGNDDYGSYAPTSDWCDLEDDCFVAADGTRFLWGTTLEKPRINLEDEVDSCLEEHHESAREHVDFEKLRAAQVLVDEALDRVVSCFPDESVAVILPPKKLLCAECDEEEDIMVCTRCKLPACAEHSRPIDSSDGSTVSVCTDCMEKEDRA